jgi:hypothetical protein
MTTTFKQIISLYNVDHPLDYFIVSKLMELCDRDISMPVETQYLLEYIDNIKEEYFESIDRVFYGK